MQRPPVSSGEIDRLTNEAVSLYCETAVLNPGQIDEVRADFRRFYMHVIAAGLRGIRWNFDHCLLCTNPQEYAILFRILIVHPTVVAAAGGRPLGTLLCIKHVNASPEEQVAGALERIRSAPPRRDPVG